jgi:TonB family protein
MNQDPRVRPDVSMRTPAGNEKPPDHATAFFSSEPSRNVTQVAQMLAAHGGGAVSVDLALDLVLTDVVEQAREATGATGAAIALLRDGEMVCRATSGENAPDLGVRVETGSGLAASCLSTGQIQQCRDTETDARVSAEVCRRLGVRSMTIVPLIDAGAVFGILQVFSAWPNAFGEREIATLRILATRIVDSKREAEAGAGLAPGVEDEPQVIASVAPENAEAQEDRIESRPPDMISPDAAKPPRKSEIWNSVLVLLVIAAAVLLGLALGWHGAIKGFKGRSQTAKAVPSVASADAPSNSSAQQPAPVPSSTESTSTSTPGSVTESNAPSAMNSSQPASGALVITENGKVVYRSSTQNGPVAPRTKAEPSGSRLIRRVEPEYPADARAQGIQGPVVLDVQIGGDGAVTNVDVVSGDPLLANAAVQAIKQWRYRPYFVDGRAVESQARITIRFTLPAS